MAEIFDVLIVGGGISGVSLAARLAERARVAIVEAEEHLGMHATGRSAALLVEAYGAPVIRMLTGRSRAFFERPPLGFNEAPLARRRGSLVYADESGIEQLRGEYESARRTTEAAWLDDEAVLRACPLLKPGVAAAGFLEPNALDLDANALLQGFARTALHAGASIWKAAPLRIARRENGIWRVTAGERKIAARILVDASGPWADSVAAIAGVSPLLLQPMRRTAATIEVPAELVPRLAETPLAMPVDQTFYFKPEARAIMVSLSEETPSDPCDAWPDDLDVALALDRFHAATIVPPVKPTATWAGLRTFAPDRNPVVGFDAVVPGFFWYAGQGGYGIQTSPALSAFGAKLILGDPLDEAEAGIASVLSSRRFGLEASLTRAL
jgi:D-arginine dehydrogenase